MDFDPAFVAAGRASEFQAAAAELNSRTDHCFRIVRWQDVPADSQFLYFVPSSGCSSQIGRGTCTYQTINIAPGCSKGSIIHETMHALGACHEHQRTDRDQYVRINNQNIALSGTGIATNFGIYSTTLDVGPYDFGSLMHYGRAAFGNGAGDTITTLDPTKQNVIGNRDAMSAGDIATVNFLLSGSLPPSVEKPPPPRCGVFDGGHNDTVVVISE